MGSNYSGVFEDWEIAIARKLSSEFLAAYGRVKNYDLDDLMQEGLLQWHLARHSYQADKGTSRETYMAEVVRRRLLNILGEWLAEKRTADRLAVSLDQIISDEGLTLEETIPVAKPIDVDPSLRLDLERTMANMSTFQKTLCLLLRKGYNVTDIAALLHKARPTIYDEIARVKKAFADAGLDEYLT